MRNLLRRCAALLLALGLCLGLAACQDPAQVNEFKAETYVDGVLKELYLGEFDEEYLQLVGINEAAAQRAYEDALETEASYFIALYSIEYPTDKFREDVAEMYREIFSHARWEVVSAARQEDGSYSVKVNVEPVDIVQLVENDKATQDAYKDFGERYPAEELNLMDKEQYERVDQRYASMILKLYQDKLPDIGNSAAVSVTLQLEKNDDGDYAIVTEDFQRLSETIIDYRGSGSDGANPEG